MVTRRKQTVSCVFVKIKFFFRSSRDYRVLNYYSNCRVDFSFQTRRNRNNFFFFVLDTRSLGTTIVGGRNMQMFHSLRCKQIDMTTANQLILNFRNDNETSLSIYVKSNLMPFLKSIYSSNLKFK